MAARPLCRVQAIVEAVELQLMPIRGPMPIVGMIVEVAHGRLTGPTALTPTPIGELGHVRNETSAAIAASSVAIAAVICGVP